MVRPRCHLHHEPRTWAALDRRKLAVWGRSIPVISHHPKLHSALLVIIGGSNARWQSNQSCLTINARTRGGLPRRRFTFPATTAD
jgi:hypothetical protein